MNARQLCVVAIALAATLAAVAPVASATGDIEAAFAAAASGRARPVGEPVVALAAGHASTRACSTVGQAVLEARGL